MFVGVGDHLWEMLGAVYYLYKWRGYEDIATNTINYAYQYVCTCRELADEFTTSFGGDKQSQIIMSTCHEKSSELFEKTYGV